MRGFVFLALAAVLLVARTAAAEPGDVLGSGDGQIHIIPSVNREGGKVTFSAVVKSRQPVAAVTARIGGTAVTLSPKPLAGVGMLPSGETVGVYGGEWEGDAGSAVTFTVRDASGHEYADRSLAQRDDVLGHSVPGTINYPNGRMTRGPGLILDGENDVRCAVIDPAGGAAYFGTDTSPGYVVKVDLDSFTRVGAVSFLIGEDSPRAAVIDLEAHAAYFGTHTAPGRVVKVDLDTFTRVGSAMLESGENWIYGGVFDPFQKLAYFGTSTAPGRIIKFDTDAMQRVDAMTLDPGEDHLRTAVIDPARGELFFGTFTSPAAIIRIDLATFLRTGTLVLPLGEDYLRSAVLDPIRGHAYFGADRAPGRITKVDLDTFTRVGAITLAQGGNWVRSAVIDPEEGNAFFGTYDPIQVVKLDLSTFSVVGTIPFAGWGFRCAVIDSTRRMTYFAKGTYFVDVAQVSIDPFARVRENVFGSGVIESLECAVIDPVSRAAYFGTDTRPGRVVKIDLATFTRAGAITLNWEEQYLATAFIDSAGRAAYFGTGYPISPGRVVKIDLTTFTRIGAITLDRFDGSIGCAVVDPAGDAAYFGTGDYGAGRVVKIDLATFTRVGAITLDWGENYLASAVIDPPERAAYFGTGDYGAGHVVKIDLETFTRVGAITLNSGEDTLSSAAIDPANRAAYFGTYTSPGRVVKIDLATFKRVGAIMLNSGENELRSAVLDPAGGAAYFGTLTSPGRVVKVDLANFMRAGAITLTGGVFNLRTAIIDPAAGVTYFGRGWYGAGRVTPVFADQRHVLRASAGTLDAPAGVRNLHFFSHAARGNLRFAIYDNAESKHLLWQSGSVPNTGGGAEVVVPIVAGTPPVLRLERGTYWLAWQTDSTANVGSYTPGVPGDGMSFPMEYGPAPDIVPAGMIAGTSEVWTEYLTVTPSLENDIVDFSFVPAGTFTMGRTDVGDDAMGHKDELPRHEVALSEYFVSEIEITNAQYADVLNWALGEGLLENRDGVRYEGGNVYRGGRMLVKVGVSNGEGRGSKSKTGGIAFDGAAFVPAMTDAAGGPVSVAGHPVVNVTWHGAAAFCNFLALREGRPTAYDWGTWELVRPEKGDGVETYRLPTEAEWERAAAWDGERHFLYGFSAGEISASHANFKPAGARPANPLGLLGRPLTAPAGWYDGENPGTEVSTSPAGLSGMSGNAMEWCHDRYGRHYYAASPAADPFGPETGPHRVVRGGGWNSGAGDCRTASRQNMRPAKARDDIGFRVVAATVQGGGDDGTRIAGADCLPTPSPTPTPTPTPVR
ncbi:SUMF1/EgtB/PvdO family nonheme iron enzyme [Candidatus Poribacteria bacterium]|nr:SUMF1/EgtB/PvdO family nonheme iron enzyme [Candidatus Poribacteria bacterium]